MAAAAPLAISAGASIAGGMSQASALRAQADYESRIADINARLAGFQADEAIRRGEKDVAGIQRRRTQFIGKQRAALAAQGIDIESGTPLQTQEDTASMAAEDIMTTRNNAWREAWGLRAGAQDIRGRAEFGQLAARAGARSSILTGGLNAASDITRGLYNFESGRSRGRKK